MLLTRFALKVQHACTITASLQDCGLVVCFGYVPRQLVMTAALTEPNSCLQDNLQCFHASHECACKKKSSNLQDSCRHRNTVSEAVKVLASRITVSVLSDDRRQPDMALLLYIVQLDYSTILYRGKCFVAATTVSSILNVSSGRCQMRHSINKVCNIVL